MTNTIWNRPGVATRAVDALYPVTRREQTDPTTDALAYNRGGWPALDYPLTAHLTSLAAFPISGDRTTYDAHRPRPQIGSRVRYLRHIDGSPAIDTGTVTRAVLTGHDVLYLTIASPDGTIHHRSERNYRSTWWLIDERAADTTTR